MLDQRKVSFLGSLGVATMIAGCITSCITVNVYFPVKELREAADQIVDEVRPDIASAEDSDAKSASLPPIAWTLLTVSFVKSAWADEKSSTESSNAVINASSPKIKKIKASLKARYKKLLPLYTAGRIGEGQDGNLVVREVKDLNLKERRMVNTLVKAENADRKSLYTTIARESKIADAKIKDIGRLFSRSWQKKSKTGWWIEVKKGKWVKKPKEVKKSKKPSAKKSESAV